MDIFTTIVLIVAIVAFNKSYRCRMAAGSQKSAESAEYLMRHIDHLEDRLANLETIVIEKERERRFTDL